MDNVTYKDEGPLLDWLLGIEEELEGPLLDGTEAELLFIAGQIDRLLVGDLREVPAATYETLLDQLATVQIGSGSDAHTQGFRAINIAGHMNAEEREVAFRIQARLGTELAQRRSREEG